jgi:hypothetical protein
MYNDIIQKQMEMWKILLFYAANKEGKWECKTRTNLR